MPGRVRSLREGNVRDSWADERRASASGTPAGVAVIWLVFYALIFAGWLGCGKTRPVPNAYARSPAPPAAFAGAKASVRAVARSARTARPD